MKNLLLLIVCLSAKALVGAEPPPSPRDGRHAAQEAFKQRLREQAAAQRHTDRLLEISLARR